MLDSNTDRMWYVIGTVFLVTALIFFVDQQYPDLFHDVMGMFREESEVEYVAAEVGETEVEIPYDIEYTMDDSEDVRRPGEKGLKIVYDDGRENVIKEPVNRIELYPYEGRTVPFSVEYTTNPDKPVGWSEVVQEGVDGQFFDFYNPHDPSEIIGEYEGIRELPVPQIIDQGSAPWVEIPYETEYTLDSNQVRDGVVGRKFTDSTGEDHIDENAVNEVVLYPTKKESIPYTEKRVAVDDLLEGEERVASSGVDGSKTVHYHPDTGEVVKEVIEKNPVERVIEYGTTQVADVSFDVTYTTDSSQVRNGQVGKKYVYQDGREEQYQAPVNQVKMYPSTTISIPYSVEERNDPNMLEGETRVSRQGRAGQKIEYTDPDTGKVVDTHIISSPISKIIYQGTKKAVKNIYHEITPGMGLWSITGGNGAWMDWIVTNNNNVTSRDDVHYDDQNPDNNRMLINLEYSNGVRKFN